MRIYKMVSQSYPDIFIFADQRDKAAFLYCSLRQQTAPNFKEFTYSNCRKDLSWRQRQHLKAATSRNIEGLGNYRGDTVGWEITVIPDFTHPENRAR